MTPESATGYMQWNPFLKAPAFRLCPGAAICGEPANISSAPCLCNLRIGKSGKPATRRGESFADNKPFYILACPTYRAPPTIASPT